MKARKYQPGHVITDYHEVLHALLAGCWFYWPSSPRPKHPSVLLNMSAMVLINAARRGHLRIAVPAQAKKENAA